MFCYLFEFVVGWLAGAWLCCCIYCCVLDVRCVRGELLVGLLLAFAGFAWAFCVLRVLV